MELARYDQNWDVRDRVRLLRALLLGKNGKNTRSVDGDSLAADGVKGGTLAMSLKKILLSAKATPTAESPYAGRTSYNLGTLSHALNRAIPSYTHLPQWPASVPAEAAAQRNVEEIGERWNRDRVVSSPVTVLRGKEKVKKRVITLEEFYNESESESESTEEEITEESEEAETEESEEEEDEDEEEDENENDDSNEDEERR